jgi:IclR family pca regulon transcriptional regulator
MTSELPALTASAPDYSRYLISSLRKGLAVLRLFDGSTTRLRLKEIGERAGIPLPTTFRIVATLEAEGFLERAEDGTIGPGVAVLPLGSAALGGSDLVLASERPLRALAQATGETVNLGVLQGDRVLYLARLRNADLVSANIQVGSTLPAVWTSMGKLLLAYVPVEEIPGRIGADAFTSPRGPNAVTSLEQLTEQLTEIRAQGFAIQDQELSPGLCSVAAPIFARETDSAPVGAINVAASSAHQDADALRGPILERTMQAAREVTLRFGLGASRGRPAGDPAGFTR